MIARSLHAALLAGTLLLAQACDITPEPGADTSAVVNRGNGGEPGTLDPARADDIHAFNILADLYEGLVTESADGRLLPGVAESWSVSDDGLTYTFLLNPSARWSDGAPVTASDFVRGFRRVGAPETASTYAYLLEPIEGMAEALAGDRSPDQIGVRAVDERTLTITLTRPTNYLLSLLAMPVTYPAHVDGPVDGIGNGAFVIESRQPGTSTTLRRNPHYRDSGSVRIDGVVYLPVTDLSTELNMFRAGELDITNSVPPEVVRSPDEQLAGNLRIAPELALYYVAFDMTEPPLDDSDLRRALSMAIDRQTIVSILGRGEIPAYAVVPPGVDGYAGPAYDWQTHSNTERIAAARDAYRAAGYGEENPLKLRLLYDTGDVHETVATAVAAMWRDELGVDVELENREWAYFLDTRSRRDEWDAMRFSWFGDYNSPMTFLEIFTSDSSQNLARYRSEEFDSRLRDAAATIDPPTAMDRVRGAESVLIEDYPVAPLYFFVSKHLVSDRIDGFEDNALNRHPSRFLSIRTGQPR